MQKLNLNLPLDGSKFGDRKGTTKKLCDKDFAERSGELSGAICFKTLGLLKSRTGTAETISQEPQGLVVKFSFIVQILSGEKVSN